jgi:hypothetical protein
MIGLLWELGNDKIKFLPQHGNMFNRSKDQW